MCKGQRGDRWGPATLGGGGPTGPRWFIGAGGSRVGAGAAPHPGGLTRIVQPRESSRECRGEGGLAGEGLLGAGRVGDKRCAARGGAARGRAPRLGGGGSVRGGPRPVPAPLMGREVCPRRVGGGHPGPALPPSHPSQRAGGGSRVRRWGGEAAGTPPPLCKSARGEFPPLHNWE